MRWVRLQRTIAGQSLKLSALTVAVETTLISIVGHL